MSDTKWVYGFHQVGDAEEHAGDWEAVRSLLGGKGANLGEMTRIGVPVPPGFTVTTDACLAYLDAGAKAAMLHSDVTFEIAAVIQSIIFYLVTAQAVYSLFRSRKNETA